MLNEYRLLTPGPVQMPPEILRALGQNMIHHRTPEFEDVLKRCLKNLKAVFQTQQPVLILPSTGSGGMEAALVNLFSPGDELLSIVSGKFGERWSEMAQAFGLNVTTLNVPWGEAVDPIQVRKHLEQNPRIRGVMTQACETSTATLHPVKELAEITRESGALLLVDGITALGAMDLPMDLWGIDVLVAGSQKAFMLPTGLAFIALSERAWERSVAARCPRFYFDLARERKANESTQTYFSSSVTLIRALDVALNLMLKEGLSSYVRKYTRLAEALRAGGEALGLKIYSKAPSPSVTAFLVPDGLDSEKLRLHLERSYRITVMGGQDQLKGKILRVGTLGYVRPEDILAVVEATGQALKDFGFKADTDGAIRRTREALARP